MPRIVLRSRSAHARVTLDAACLVEQFAVSEEDTLLVLDEDTPYEEQLHLALIRANKVIDHVLIGSIYSGGIFKLVDMSEGTLRFRFESDAIWSLSINRDGKRGFGGLPTGSRRRGRVFSRHHLFLQHGDAA